MNIVDRIISPNLWDEEWDNGYLDAGQPVAGTNVRSKNFVKIKPSERLYFYCSFNVENFWVSYYDSNKAYIKIAYVMRNSIATPPQNASYLKFYIPQSYGTIYKHDICINESNPSINGKYFPYVMYKRYDMVDLIHTHNLWNKTVKYNQFIKNPEFKTSLNWSSGNTSRGTISISNNELTYTIIQVGSSYSNGFFTTIENSQVIIGHKYLLAFRIKSNKSGIGVGLDAINYTNNYNSVVFTTQNYQNVSVVFTPTSFSRTIYLCTRNVINAEIGDTITINQIYLIDLTEWFKGDIPQSLLDNPSTFNEYWDGELPYDTGTDVLPNNSIKRLKIGG